MTLTADFERPQALWLIEAARTNDAGKCESLFGWGGDGSGFINTRALRVAAEHKSYAAFDRMIDVACLRVSGLGNEFSLGLGEDYMMVRKIAESDPLIAAALQRFDEAGERATDELLEDVRTLESVPAWKRFLKNKFDF